MLGGGCSYLEWVQGLYVFWDEQRVREMEALMVQAYHQVLKSRKVPRSWRPTHTGGRSPRHSDRGLYP